MMHCLEQLEHNEEGLCKEIKEKELELTVCRRFAEELKGDTKNKEMMNKELEEAYEETMLHCKKENSDLKKERMIKKKVLLDEQLQF